MGSLRIVSRSDERFRDRREAGRLLGEQLRHIVGADAVVLGIPRGGVIVARELAHAMGAKLDIILARKLRTPGHPELALGSVAEDGRLFLNQSVIRDLGVDDAYIEQERQVQLAEIRRRTALIRTVLPRLSVRGKVAIVTDDGAATGATFQAALWSARQEEPRQLIAALPVAPEETVRALALDADELICLRVPPFFAAVGQFYERFEQFEDAEIIEILREEGRQESQNADQPGERT